MEKINFKQKLEQNINYRIGIEEFRKLHNLEIEYPEARKLLDEGKTLRLIDGMKKGVKYSWYKKKVLGKDWRDKYENRSHIVLNMIYDTKLILGKEKKILREVEIAFLAVIPPKDCLEITNVDELRKIQLHREATNFYPQPFEKIK